LNAASSQLRSESFGYDADGNQASATNWDGNATNDAYNAAGEMTSQVVPVSSSSSVTTSYGYDAAGNRTSITGGNQNTTWTTYNSWNLPEKVVEPTIAAAPSTANTTWTTAYGKTGLPATVTEPGGVSLSYGYDPLGDLTSESGSGASASTAAQSLTYDLDGRMASASAPGGTDSFSYYADSRLKNATGPSGASGYTYNSDGLVASQTSAAGTASYTYDGADRLATETEPLTGAKLTWGYNSDSNPTSISYSTGGTAGPTETLVYNSLQRLTSDTLTSASSATMASEAYGYDSNGNVTSQTTGGLLAASSQTYGYDEANRLTSATSGGTTTGYGYDGDGNLTQDGAVTDSYNAEDQLTSATGNAGTTSYSYALDGSLTSVTPASGSAQNYTWDAYGNMASANGVSYGYDALGRMVTRTGSAGTTSMSYLGAGTSLASDGTSRYSYDPSGTMTAEGPASGGAGYAVMTDQHGDVAAAFAPTSSASSLEGRSSYSPYGTATASGSMPGAGYQGDYTDPVTGLVYMNARWYNPATGGFVSSDTAGGTPVPSTVDGNPYAYAGGNPLTETDPSGHLSCVTTVGGFVICPGGSLGGASGSPGDGTGIGSVCGWCGIAAGSQGSAGTGVQGGLQGQPSVTGSYQMFPGNIDWAAVMQRLFPTSGGGGGSSGGGGGGGGGGYVGCVYYCGYTSPAPQPAPPPPPPPQNCYAGPDPTCTPTPAPGALLDGQLITRAVSNPVSLATLKQQGLFISEHEAPVKTTVKGLTTGPGGNGNGSGSGSGTNGNISVLIANITGIGLPAAPAPGGPGSSKYTRQLAKKVANAVAPVVQSVLGPVVNQVTAIAGAAASCITHPRLGTCLTAAAAVLPLLIGGGEAAALTDTTDIAAEDTSMANAAAADCGGMSFTADTKVLLANGKKTPIASLKPGDRVLATNTKTGKTSAEPVGVVLVHHDSDLYDLKVRSGRTTAVIDTTSSHLFWVPGTHRWVKAAALRRGTHLRTPGGTDATVVGGYVPRQRDGWMWDLNIPGDHDFYVIPAIAVEQMTDGNQFSYDVEGEFTPVLVHNCNPAVDFNVPKTPGVYTIHTYAGDKYVGSATWSIRERVANILSSRHAFTRAGYSCEDICNVTWVELPRGVSSITARRVEQTVMEGWKSQGFRLLNRRDPEIDVSGMGSF
jgi:RHS repeat-associated protein